MKKIVCVVLSVTMLFLFTACGTKTTNGSSVTKETSITKAAKTTTAKTIESEDTSDIELKVSETEDTLTWKIADGSYYKIVHDGNTITDFEIYINFKSKDEAKESAKRLNQLNSDPENTIQSITAQGTYVVYRYNKSGYIFKDYKEAKENFDALKALGY